MTLDQRIQPKTQPQYGCHSNLDYLRAEMKPIPCTYPSAEERACEGCKRQQDDQKGGAA